MIHHTSGLIGASIVNYSTNNICPICGTIYSLETRGRPRTYCSPNCRDTHKYLDAFVKCLDAVSFRSQDSIKSMRGRLFNIVNHMPKQTS